jgi:tetratricopeptide (TPR) repeat protein
MKEHTAVVTSISLSPDGRYALSGSYDKTLKLWEGGRCLRTFEGHTGVVASVALSPEGRYALSASQDETLRVWVLDWELEESPRADWDEGARPHLWDFLSQRAAELLNRGNADEMALARRGQQTWSEEDFRRLLNMLACVGFGRLRAEGVRQKLESMWAEWAQTAFKPITDDRTEVTLSSLGVKWAEALRIADGLIKRRELENASLLLVAFVAEIPPDWKPIKTLPDALEGYFWSSDDFISYVNYHRKELNEQSRILTWVDASYSKAYYLLAYIQAELGNYETALKMLEQGLLIEPDEPQLLNEKGYILGRKEDFEESLAAYTQALNARPWTPDSIKGVACRGRGVALIDLRRLDEAEEALRLSLVYAPGNETALRELQYIRNLREDRMPKRARNTNPES